MGRAGRWAALALFASVLVAIPASAAAAAAPAASVPTINIGVGTTSSPAQVGSSVQILLALTVLSLAPAVLLLMTSFTRIVVVLSFARNALGSGQLPPNQILVGLALFLTLFVMAPTFQKIYSTAWQPYQAGTIDLAQAVQAAESPLQAFMLRQTRPADLKLFLDMQSQGQGTAAAPSASSPSSSGSGPALPVPAAAPSAAAAGGGGSGGGAAAASAPPPALVVLVPAFVISELRTAFEMGFVLFVPFVIIDLVVASTLMAMGMVMLPPMLISLPFKILLFVLVDGWSLLAQSLVTSFR